LVLRRRSEAVPPWLRRRKSRVRKKRSIVMVEKS
jgi:hypothetical protein